jgi:hypothetical protein
LKTNRGGRVNLLTLQAAVEWIRKASEKCSL